MMIEFFISFFVFALAVTGLSLGVMFGRDAPQSCAGKSNHEACGGCQRTCDRRENKND